MSHSQRQLNQLSECLIALPPENDGMLLSEFDGFVAGILVCPEMILPSEWLGSGPINRLEAARSA